MESNSIQLLNVYFTDIQSARSVIKDVYQHGIGETDEEKPDYFNWTVDNKYFTANISTCCVSQMTFDMLDSKQLTNIEAVLIICDANEAATLSSVKHMMQKVELQGETCLLLSLEMIQDTKARDDIFACCIENGFELIEVCDSVEDENNDEKCGIDRVAEALNSHVWNGHEMKDEHDAKVSNVFDKNVRDSDFSHDDTSFEDLFSQFLTMKEHAKTLGDVERRAYAEKVSLAFMEALGIEDDTES